VRYLTPMGILELHTRFWSGEAEGKKSLGRARRRWEDHIRRDFLEVGWEAVDWLRLAQVRDQYRDVVITVMNFRVP